MKAMEFLFDDIFKNIESRILKYTHEEGHNFLEGSIQIFPLK